MKKFGFAIAIVLTLVVALVSTTFVFAQSTTPATPQAPGTGFGRGGMNGGGMMGGRGAGMVAGDGILHDDMIAVYAAKLGLSVDALNARLDSGETIAQIAAEKGLTAEQFSTLFSEARSQALDQAVKAGTLTQAQADWMKTRGGMLNGAAGNQGMRGAGRGGMRGAGTTDCPYYPQTNP